MGVVTGEVGVVTGEEGVVIGEVGVVTGDACSLARLLREYESFTCKMQILPYWV